jgi:hypothetical protein
MQDVRHVLASLPGFRHRGFRRVNFSGLPFDPAGKIFSLDTLFFHDKKSILILGGDIFRFRDGSSCSQNHS